MLLLLQCSTSTLGSLQQIQDIIFLSFFYFRKYNTFFCVYHRITHTPTPIPYLIYINLYIFHRFVYNEQQIHFHFICCSQLLLLLLMSYGIPFTSWMDKFRSMTTSQIRTIYRRKLYQAKCIHGKKEWEKAKKKKATASAATATCIWPCWFCLQLILCITEHWTHHRYTHVQYIPPYSFCGFN